MNVLLKCKTFCKKMNKTFYISLMKRLILVIIVIYVSFSMALAQPKALGLRGGYDIQLSYQHNVEGRSDFVEVDAGMQFLKPVDVECAVEVVDFVLEDYCCKALDSILYHSDFICGSH